jgi:hypothetical protein
LVSSAAPMYMPEIRASAPFLTRLNYCLIRWLPFLLKWSFRLTWWYSRGNPEAFLQLMLKQSSQADREAMKKELMYLGGIEVWKENIRVDSAGYYQDTKILMAKWGFDLADIQAKV